MGHLLEGFQAKAEKLKELKLNNKKYGKNGGLGGGSNDDDLGDGDFNIQDDKDIELEFEVFDEEETNWKLTE